MGIDADTREKHYGRTIKKPNYDKIRIEEPDFMSTMDRYARELEIYLEHVEQIVMKSETFTYPLTETENEIYHMLIGNQSPEK